MKKSHNLVAPFALAAALVTPFAFAGNTADSVSEASESSVDNSAAFGDVNFTRLDDTEEKRACAQRCDEARPGDVEACLKEKTGGAPRTVTECNKRAWDNYYACVDRCNN